MQGTGVFAESRDDPKFKHSKEKVITIQELEQAFMKIDFFADRHLDRTEFLLLTLDRVDLYDKEILLQLYRIWSESTDGLVTRDYHLHSMLENANTTE